jgi:hypothetical protein
MFAAFVERFFDSIGRERNGGFRGGKKLKRTFDGRVERHAASEQEWYDQAVL